MALDDDIVSGCPEVICNFVRTNPDIDVYDYIQRGCNGEVYFGRRKKLDDEVVLKFYHAQPHYDASEEAAILRKIDHPNILKIWHLGLVDNKYAYFLTPKISGGDLQSHIDKGGIATSDALRIIAGILTGLVELHSTHSLVHRDLKPGNILIDLVTSRPIIADLGSVKKVENADGYVSESKATRIYLPPESVLHMHYNFRSDIYQVGLIMFQLLNGNFPIHEPYKWLNAKQITQLNGIRNSIEREINFHQMIDSIICKGKIANTDTLPAYLDPPFKRVLHRALHMNIEQRIPNASEFLKEVHKLINHYPSYLQVDNYLHVDHNNGKEYRIISGQDGLFLEKKIAGKTWRRDNEHDGSYKGILQKSRNK